MNAAISNTTLTDSVERGMLRFITAGSVDDGKSTLIGRLLFDSKGIFADQLDAMSRSKHKRTVGDISCTCPVSSDAATVDAIIAETAITQITERGATRMDDQTSEASMEKRKKAGYF